MDIKLVFLDFGCFLHNSMFSNGVLMPSARNCNVKDVRIKEKTVNS